ncbi:MAG: hypothetical protein CXT75_04535 [Methanobacteriota archaeon]|jgi:hypothetical protein|nr:MAG: hypothetical protein CXT75_04535 [Euryarchaeota archaeon]
MNNGINSDILKGIFLSLITISTLTTVFYLNVNEEDKIIENEYLKSDICYYSLNGIKSDYHYHFQLNITINDERSEIPMNVGFELNETGELIFLHPIHTYDNSGRIHIETTRDATALLGFFFDIWEKDFTKNKILDYETDEQHIIEVKVNGNSVETYEDTILEPYIFIDIEYRQIN